MTDAQAFDLKMAAAGARGYLKGLLQGGEIPKHQRALCERVIRELGDAIWPENNSTREAGVANNAPAAHS